MKATITEEFKVVNGVKCSMKHIDQKHLNNQQNDYKSRFLKKDKRKKVHLSLTSLPRGGCRGVSRVRGLSSTERTRS